MPFRRLFMRMRDAAQHRLAEAPAAELDAVRQTVRGKAARQTDRGECSGAAPAATAPAPVCEGAEFDPQPAACTTALAPNRLSTVRVEIRPASRGTLPRIDEV